MKIMDCNESDSSLSDSEYEMFPLRSSSLALPFDPKSLENIILLISDHFNFRVVLSDQRARRALLMTSGLTIAGGLIGRQYGGKVGAAVGSALGGACGLGIIAVSMREIWEEIKSKLYELFDIVYDYIAGMGIDDYTKVAIFLAKNSSTTTQLAWIIMETVSSVLGKKVLSSLRAA